MYPVRLKADVVFHLIQIKWAAILENIPSNIHLTKTQIIMCIMAIIHGPVAQSIVSLMSLLISGQNVYCSNKYNI